MSDETPTLEEIHLTLEQFEDEAFVDEEGTLYVPSLGWTHRCPLGTPCRDASEAMR